MDAALHPSPAAPSLGRASPFVICFIARSGSTALTGHLRRHPAVTMRAEVFGAPTLPDGRPQTDDDRIAYLRDYWRLLKPPRRRDNLPWKGFKWQIDQAARQFAKPRRLLMEMRAHEAKLIVLRRRNVVKQALSALNSQRLGAATGSGHLPVGAAHALGPLHVDVAQLRRIVAGIEATQPWLTTLAAEYGDHLPLVYEDFLAAPDTVLGTLADFLGLPPAAEYLAPAFQKITSDRLEDAVENLDELRAAFAGTRHAAMLR